MGNKWQTTSLKELGVRLIDCDHKTPKAVESGIPYIGIPQMDNGRINFDANPRLISEDDFKHWTRKANPMYGDIILSRRCNSGETVYVPRNSKFALGQNLVLLRPEGERVHPEYLRWAVHGKEWWNEVAKYLNPGAIFESLKCADIPKFRIPEPPISAQIKIVEHLSAISGKIELNQKINQTLEQMAQALFKSWFVDFDPVFDNLLASADFKLENLETSLPDELIQKAQRRLAALNSLENVAQCKASLSALAHELQAQLPTKEATQAAVRILGKTAETPVKANFSANPTILAQHANTHAHFPSEFEHNEQLGWIPKGWEIKAVSEAIQINPRTSLSKGSVAKFADMKSIPTSGYMIDEIIEKPFSGGVKFKRNDILLARITPCLQNGKTAWVDFLKEDEVGFGSTEFIVLRENNSISFPFIACLAKDDSFRAHCMQSMVGSSGRQRVQNACFDSYYLALPKGDVLKDMFTELTKLNFEKMTNNKLESEFLSKLRDTLLPKLISGELQIPDSANVSDNNI